MSDEYDNGFEEGIKFGLELFAWWKDGGQYVGQQRPDGTGYRVLSNAIETAIQLYRERKNISMGKGR